MKVRIADSKLDTRIRWMIRRDMPQVLGIEEANFQFPWSEDDFIRCLRQRNCIGMVAMDTANKKCFGYMIYELHGASIRLLSIAVHAACQGRGIGAAMIAKLAGKLNTARRDRITTDVRESNLDAQMFFRAMGFRAVGVLPGFYVANDEDAYEFVLKIGEAT